MTYFKFRLTCKDGGSGWGRTGARALMCAPGATWAEAEEFVKRHIPGGWKYKLVGPTRDTFYLRHL